MMTVSDILANVKDGRNDGAVITADKMQNLYERASEVLGDPNPLVTVIRTDSVLIWQFSEYAPFRIVIYDRRRTIGEKELTYIKRLDYVDTLGANHSFMRFIGSEVANNLPWLGLLCAIYFVICVTLGNYDGLSNLFNVASQVVSIFTAVYIVFVAVQTPRHRFDLRLFSEGHLSDYHRDDEHLTVLAIIAIFTSLFGAIIANTHRSLPISLSVGTLRISFDFISILIGALALLQLAEVLILFLSLPKYYLKRSKRFLFRELAEQLLEERHTTYRHKHNVVPFPSSDTTDNPSR